MVMGAVLIFFGQACAVSCDVDHDGKIGLPEAVFSLQVAAVLREQGSIQCDVDGNGKAGLPEAIFALRVTSAMAPPALSSDMPSLVNKTVAAISTSIRKLKDIQQFTTVTDKLNLDDALTQSVREYSVESVMAYLQSHFSCGTISLQLPKTIVFTFNGQCGGISGTVKVTPALENADLIFTVEYSSVQISSISCTINGTATTMLTVTGTQVTAVHTFSNMNICGQTLSGTITIVYDRTSGTVISVSGQSSGSYGDPAVTVSLTYTYSPTSGMSGTAAINQTTFTFTGIRIDPTCGIPTAGTLTVDNITFDFSSTTCDNPTVAVKIGNLPYYTVSMEEAKTLLQTLYSST